MSARLVRRAAQRQALGINDTRGQRFANAVQGTHAPRFGDVAACPLWLTLDPAAQARVAVVTTLIAHQSALTSELSGTKLAAIAAMVGDDMIDAVCTLDGVAADDAPRTLPRPDQMESEGWHILRSGLPLALAQKFPGAAGNSMARAQSEAAYDLVMGL